MDRVGQGADDRGHGRRVVQPGGSILDGAGQLARVERVALGPLDDRLHDLRRRPLEEVVHEGSDREIVERLEVERHVVPSAAAPRRASVQQLGTGQDDHQQRRLAAGLKDHLDQVEERVARPVEVLDDHDQRLLLCGELDSRPPRGEELAAVDMLTLPGSEGRRQQFRCPPRERIPAVGEPLFGRLPDGLGIGIVREAEQPHEERVERPVRQPLPIGQALRDHDPCA